MKPEQIINIVCRYFNTTIEHEKIFSSNRNHNHLIVRYFVFLLLKEHTILTLNEIGSTFGQNHSTTFNAITKLRIWIQSDMSKYRAYFELKDIIKQNERPVKVVRNSLAVRMIYRRLKNPMLSNVYHSLSTIITDKV